MRDRVAVVVGSTALFAAVLGATPLGHAARSLVLPANSVGTAQLRANAVTSAKIKDHSLLERDFKPGQIRSGPQGPPGLQGPPGPSHAFAVSSDKPIPIRVGDTPGPVAALAIPLAGSYVIQATLYLTSTGSGIAQLTCRLDTRETDSDEVQVLVGGATPAALQVVHDYPAAGVAELVCVSRAPADARAVRIVAIHVGSLTSTTLG